MPHYNNRRRYTSKRTYRGHGAYDTSLDNGRWANRGADIGGYAANMFGIPHSVGAYAGRRLFHYPAKWLGSGAYRKKRRVSRRKGRKYGGHGDYSVSSGNNGTLQPDIPTFDNGSGDSIEVCHKEYIGDIITSSVAGAFKLQEFTINPGDPTSFPWLSELCQTSFQQYRFSGCIFHFKSTSANALNSTNTALGSVISAINYDSTDPSFASRMQMENTSWANSSKPSNDMQIPVECAPRQTTGRGLLFVATNGVLPQHSDAKTYHLGKLSIATTGFQGTDINIGSLYVTYKVRLHKPIMLAPLAQANRALYVRSLATSAAPMGTGTVSGLASNCDTLGIVFNSTQLTINKARLQIGQRFLFTFVWNHDSGASTYPSFSATSGLTTAPNLFGPTAATFFVRWPQPVTTVTTETGLMIAYEVVDDNANQTITLSAATLPANATLNINVLQICGTPALQLGIFSP